MFDIVSGIIDHSWIVQDSGDQQMLYCICGALIVMLTCVLVDICYRIFSHFWR